jgi:integrase
VVASGDRRRPRAPEKSQSVTRWWEELLAVGKGLLFPGKHNKVEQHMLREIQRAVKGSGVPNVKIHRFRDTYSVNKLRNGVDVRTLQRWLGHETVEQVMEYCAWLDSQSEAARRHANREDIRYQAAALPAAEEEKSAESGPVSPKAVNRILGGR